MFDPFTPHPGRERASLHIAPFYLLAGPGPHRVGDCGPRPGSPSEPGLPLPPTPIPRYKPMGPHAVAVSALLGLGLEELKARLEDAVLTATGRRVLTLRVRLAGAQLSWLHKEATVQAVDVMPEAGAADVKVIISHSAYGRFRKLFPE